MSEQLNAVNQPKAEYSISTVAGNGNAPFVEDSCCATLASASSTGGVTTDPLGNLYYVDTNNHRVRVVDRATGVVATVAGNGIVGYGKDGVCATLTSLNYPYGIAVDSSGNVYIADSSNNRVRMVDALSGQISTFAGNGIAGFTGDGGSATDARLNYPVDVAVDPVGNVYIADTYNNRVRKVDAGTGKISTFAGNGTATFSGDGGPAASAALSTPRGVALGPDGNIYIADTYNHRVRKVDVLAGKISTVVGNGTPGYSGDDGPALGAKLSYPRGVALGPDGNIYIADTYNHRVRKVDALAGKISTVAGNGTTDWCGDGTASWESALNYPGQVAVDTGGDIFIADSMHHRVRKVSIGQFSVSPAVPPTVLYLQRGGDPKRPGVLVKKEGSGTVPRTSITVTLRPERGLQFADQQLLVNAEGDGPARAFSWPGILSGDGRTLTFLRVDLGLSDAYAATVSVAVRAAPDAPLGRTDVDFNVACQPATDSTPIEVVKRF